MCIYRGQFEMLSEELWFRNIDYEDAPRGLWNALSNFTDSLLVTSTSGSEHEAAKTHWNLYEMQAAIQIPDALFSNMKHF